MVLSTTISFRPPKLLIRDSIWVWGLDWRRQNRFGIISRLKKEKIDLMLLFGHSIHYNCMPIDKGRGHSRFIFPLIVIGRIETFYIRVRFWPDQSNQFAKETKIKLLMHISQIAFPNRHDLRRTSSNILEIWIKNIGHIFVRTSGGNTKVMRSQINSQKSKTITHNTLHHLR